MGFGHGPIHCRNAMPVRVGCGMAEFGRDPFFERF